MRRVSILAALLMCISGCGPLMLTVNTTDGSVVDTADTSTDSSTDSSTESSTDSSTESSIDSSTVTEADGDVTSDGELVELPQLGLRFRIPPPLVKAQVPDTDFAAGSRDPRALLTIKRCARCRLDWEPRENEILTHVTIDGAPALIVTNAAIQLPESATANELVISDGEHDFAAIMSFEGDITPIWDAFIDSIELD